MLLWPKTANVRFYVVEIFSCSVKKDLFKNVLNVNFAMEKFDLFFCNRTHLSESIY